MPTFRILNDEIVSCAACPRLRQWCELVAAEKKLAHRDESYWGKPVPNFGDAHATLLIVGLAPAAHGANRTGRMFTGDRSGQWLYRSLYRVGAANQQTFESAHDGLALSRVMITAVNHCAPPDNKPTREEILNCNQFLRRTLHLRPWKAVLCLGSIAWNEVTKLTCPNPRPKFGHGVIYNPVSGPRLLGSYHPSQQNTFTGRLTESMLDDVMVSFWAFR